MANVAPVSARSHVGNTSRRARAARRVPAHRVTLADSLTGRFHALAFGFGLSVAVAGGWAVGSFVVGL